MCYNSEYKEFESCSRHRFFTNLSDQDHIEDFSDIIDAIIYILILMDQHDVECILHLSSIVTYFPQSVPQDLFLDIALRAYDSYNLIKPMQLYILNFNLKSNEFCTFLNCVSQKMNSYSLFEPVILKPLKYLIETTNTTIHNNEEFINLINFIHNSFIENAEENMPKTIYQIIKHLIFTDMIYFDVKGYYSKDPPFTHLTHKFLTFLYSANLLHFDSFELFYDICFTKSNGLYNSKLEIMKMTSLYLNKLLIEDFVCVIQEERFDDVIDFIIPFESSTIIPIIEKLDFLIENKYIAFPNKIEQIKQRLIESIDEN